MTVKEKRKTRTVTPLISHPVTKRPIYELIKRSLDLTMSFLFVFVWAPLLLLIALAIKLESPGPVLYRQKRIGKDGRPFTFFKFRTMYVNPDPVGFYEQLAKAMRESASREHKVQFLLNDRRVTRFGRFLRRTSLDELPALFSVIRGDMSLVGPRPTLPYEWESYSAEQRQRLSVTPGITGPWQIAFSKEWSFEEMLRLDFYYIENRSVWFDLRILAVTIPVVLFGRSGK